MTEHKNIRKSVSDAYATLVTSEKKKSCCGGEPAPKGAVALLAGYSREDLQGLPDDAVVNSFGCGNPLSFSEVKEGDAVLDLGSGAGIDILIAAKMVGPTGKAIGIDMTDEMLERANENIRASGMKNVEVRKGLIEEMPVEDASVDWVISNCVINLSPEKDKVFNEIYRVLKPGGRFLISDIVVKELPDWVRKSEALYSSCVAGAISEEEYLAGLKGAGFNEVEVKARLVYDESQLAAFIASEESGVTCCGVESIGPGVAKMIGAQMKGKVWSAKFFARKPG